MLVPGPFIRTSKKPGLPVGIHCHPLRYGFFSGPVMSRCPTSRVRRRSEPEVKVRPDPYRNVGLSWNPKQLETNGCSIMAIEILYIGNGCLGKHPFLSGCLGFHSLFASCHVSGVGGHPTSMSRRCRSRWCLSTSRAMSRHKSPAWWRHWRCQQRFRGPFRSSEGSTQDRRVHQKLGVSGGPPETPSFSPKNNTNRTWCLHPNI